MCEIQTGSDSHKEDCVELHARCTSRSGNTQCS